MAPYSSTFAWKLTWTGEPAVHGVAKSQARLSDFPVSFHFYALEREMATHSSVLAWRIRGTGEPGGLPSMGSHVVGHDWSDLAAAAAAVCVKYQLLLLKYFYILSTLQKYLTIKMFIQHFPCAKVWVIQWLKKKKILSLMNYQSKSRNRSYLSLK